MAAKQFLLGFVAGVILALVGVAIVVAFVVTRPPPEVEPPPPGPSGDVVVSVTEAYLSTLATAMARSEEESIQHVSVDVRPQGRMEMLLTAQVRVLSTSVGLTIKLQGSVAVEEQRLRLSLTNVDFIGLAIPLDMLPASLREMIEDMETDWNLTINRILLENGFVPVQLHTDDSSIALGMRVR
jgi:hypothetical protein